MKLNQAIKTLIIITSIFLCFQTASAKRNRGQFQRQPGPPPLLKEYVRYQHYNVMVDALSEVTGQSAEQIKTEINVDTDRCDVQNILKKHNVEPDKFRDAVKAKFIELFDKAVKSGIITEKQKNSILESAQNTQNMKRSRLSRRQ